MNPGKQRSQIPAFLGSVSSLPAPFFVSIRVIRGVFRSEQSALSVVNLIAPREQQRELAAFLHGHTAVLLAVHNRPSRHLAGFPSAMCSPPVVC